MSACGCYKVESYPIVRRLEKHVDSCHGTGAVVPTHCFMRLVTRESLFLILKPYLGKQIKCYPINNTIWPRYTTKNPIAKLHSNSNEFGLKSPVILKMFQPYKGYVYRGNRLLRTSIVTRVCGSVNWSCVFAPCAYGYQCLVAERNMQIGVAYVYPIAKPVSVATMYRACPCVNTMQRGLGS